jgi:peptidoglycan hydrolase-like protein with peptidoglycan-binding domain
MNTTRFLTPRSFKAILVAPLLATVLVLPTATSPVLAATCNYQQCTTGGVTPTVLIQKGVGQILSLGARGTSVSLLQKQLNKVLRTTIAVDGVFGRQTLAKVTQLQRMTGELQTGVVVPQTWEAALAGRYRVSTKVSLKYGDRGPLVKVAQQLLNRHGYVTRVDGVFGMQTWRSVVAFKAEVGLSLNGSSKAVISTRVWNALNLPHPTTPV